MISKNQEIKEGKGLEKNIKNQLDFEARQNWLGFWNLLLKIDMRNHPERYKKPDNPLKEND